MIGKVLLAILFVLLGLLLTLLLIPVYILVRYDDGEFQLLLKYSKLTVPIYPTDKGEDVKKAAEAEPPATEPTEKPGKEKSKVNREQILYSIDTLPRLLLKALRRTGKRLRIMPLKFHLLVATGDPADTAVLYGKIEGALAAFLPALHRTVRIREQDIQVIPDFCEDRMDCIVNVGIGMRPCHLLTIAFCALGGILKWYIGFKKRATKVPTSSKATVDTTAKADTTV